MKYFDVWLLRKRKKKRKWIYRRSYYQPSNWYIELQKTIKKKEKIKKKIRKWIRLKHKKMSFLEQIFWEICKRNKLPFIYSGNGKFLIGYKNPDFIYFPPDFKKCVEIVGKTFHSEDYKRKRITYYQKYGWDCLVLFKEDLMNEKELVKKLKNFIDR